MKDRLSTSEPQLDFSEIEDWAKLPRPRLQPGRGEIESTENRGPQARF
jgi:hypothetical protein